MALTPYYSLENAPPKMFGTVPEPEPWQNIRDYAGLYMKIPFFGILDMQII
jgi:hypothetical protein